MSMYKRSAGVLFLLVLSAAVLWGCRGDDEAVKSRAVFTMGLSSDELFRVEDDALPLSEAKILLMTELARCRNLYGEEMLFRTFGEQTLEESVKENTLELLGKIMVIDQMATKYQILLTQEDVVNAAAAAKEYYASLDETAKAFTGAEESDVQRLLERILLADRVFEELTADADIEISDDEARVVTFRHIMIRMADNQDAYSQILEIFDQLQQGADFDAMAERYSEDSQVEYSVGRGILDENLEEVVFALDDGEMSNVVQSAQGYHIVLCVSNFDREATEQNRNELLGERRWEAFEDTYNSFAAEQVCEFNEKRWEEISAEGETVTNTGLYDIYRSYFVE